MGNPIRALPSVSIIIPVFNGAVYLEETIRSAAQETYENFDIIVVDDGSTDETPAILERLTKEFSSLQFQRIENAGVANARNVGTEISRADYIAYLDADDLWHPTKIAKQVAALEKHHDDPTWAACYSFGRLINKESLAIGLLAAKPLRGSIFLEHLCENFVGNGSTFFVRRNVAIEIGGFDGDKAFLGCEDYDFQLRVLRRYKVEIVEEFLVGYRVFQGNMSSNYSMMISSLFALLDRFLYEPDVDRKTRRAAFAHAHAHAFSTFKNAFRWPLATKHFLLWVAYDPVTVLRWIIRRNLGQLRRIYFRIIGRRRKPIPKHNFYAYSPTQATLPSPETIAPK